MTEGTQRRLAAIVSADVVGYSLLMGVDEAGTYARLKARFSELVEPKIAEYNGRVVKLMGDGLLAEFPSVLEAVSWAVEVQTEVARINDNETDDQRIEYRVGINLGDVIVDGDDIFGDGVNIAARLQEIAKAGGVCISEKVHAEVHGKLGVDFADGGAQEMKNIAQPIHVWRWSPNGQEPVKRATVKQDTELSLPGKPSIAVLPFDNMSGDPDHEFFSDGLTEDIITELSRFSELFVIARNSSFTYKGRAVKIQDVGRDLGVRYVLEGSVRRGSNRVRVTAQLVETETGTHLWADRYDRELIDVFDLQDEITQAIVAVLPGRLELVEANRIERKVPADMAAYDYLLAGKIHHHRCTREDNSKSQQLLERAIELDPAYATAYAWKACVLGQAMGRGFRPDPGELFRQSVEAVEKAISLDQNDVECHRILCEIDMVRQHWEDAEQHNDRALSLNPNHPLLAAQKGELLTWLGKPEAGTEWVRKAMRLDRYSAPLWAHLLGRALMMLRRYAEAIEAYRQSSLERFAYHADMAGCYAALGMASDAKSEAGRALKLKPDFSTSDYVENLTYKEFQDREHHRELLRKAGLPE